MRTGTSTSPGVASGAGRKGDLKGQEVSTYLTSVIRIMAKIGTRFWTPEPESGLPGSSPDPLSPASVSPFLAPPAPV